MTLTKLWQPENRARFLIPLAALLAVLPLILGGESCGHDYPFHLSNWMEAQHQWASGVMVPRWHFGAAWNAGEPRMLFYPPLSWMIGALLGCVLPWSIAPVVFTWLALMLSGFSMHGLLKRYVSSPAALLASCAYLANPYMLFTAYERTAYAELLAAAWMPLLLAEALRPQVRARTLALAIALLWITNAPAAVVGMYSLAMIAAIRLLLEKKTQDALEYGIGAFASIALAAFYIVPVVYERRFVAIDMATILAMQPWHNFLFSHMGEPGHDAVLRTASWAALWVLLLSSACAIAALRKTKIALIPTIVAAVILFLLTPLSAPIWHHAPELRFLQFPWRFMVMETSIAAFLFGISLTKMGMRLAATVALIAILAAGFTGNHFYRQECHDDDTVSYVVDSHTQHHGEQPTDEYTPSDADNDSLAQDNPPAWTASGMDAPAKAGDASNILTTTSSNPYWVQYQAPAGNGFLVMRLRAFYGWHLMRNGVELLKRPMRNDGLFAAPLDPEKPITVELIYRWTVDQWLGLALSLLTFVLLLFQPERAHKA